MNWVSSRSISTGFLLLQTQHELNQIYRFRKPQTLATCTHMAGSYCICLLRVSPVSICKKQLAWLHCHSESRSYNMNFNRLPQWMPRACQLSYSFTSRAYLTLIVSIVLFSAAVPLLHLYINLIMILQRTLKYIAPFVSCPQVPATIEF